MHYQLLADLIVIVHFAYVLFLIVGLVLTVIGGILRWKFVRNVYFRGIHLAMIVIVVVESWLGITCPLTTWEKNLRSSSGEQSYSGDFLARFAHDWLFFDASPWVFTLLYTLFGSLVFLTWVLFPPRRNRSVEKT